MNTFIETTIVWREHRSGLKPRWGEPETAWIAADAVLSVFVADSSEEALYEGDTVTTLWLKRNGPTEVLHSLDSVSTIMGKVFAALGTKVEHVGA